MKAGTKDGGSGYAVIWCRDFRLQALRRRGGREVPVALVSGDMSPGTVSGDMSPGTG